MKPKNNFANASTAAVSKFFNHNKEESASQGTSEIQEKQIATIDKAPVQKKYADKYRMTLVLESESKVYLDVITRLDGRSITQYLNELIAADIEKRKEEFLMAAKIFKIDV